MSMIIINSYFRYQDTIDPYIHKLETLLQEYKNYKILVALNANAKSVA